MNGRVASTMIPPTGFWFSPPCGGYEFDFLFDLLLDIRFVVADNGLRAFVGLFGVSGDAFI